MASILVRESSVSDKSQKGAILRALYSQKMASTFCDVIMKVCGKEIFAHSTVLAAASPYFKSFLSMDLPRQFSQRAPQVIEIQIDGSEPNMFYEEAVAAVIDFIYTGNLKIRDDNVGQITEIAKIMQMDNIVKFCNDFSTGKLAPGENIFDDDSLKNSVGISLFQKDRQAMAFKAKARKLKSIAVQVHPKLLTGSNEEVEKKDIGTSTERWPMSRVDFSLSGPRKRGRPPKSKANKVLILDEDAEIQEVDLQDASVRILPQSERESVLNPESGLIENVTLEEADEESNPTLLSQESSTPVREIPGEGKFKTPIKSMSRPEKAEDIEATPANEVEDVLMTLGKSTRSGRVRKLPSKLRDSDMTLVKKIKEEPVEKDEIAESTIQKDHTTETSNEKSSDQTLIKLEDADAKSNDGKKDDTTEDQEADDAIPINESNIEEFEAFVEDVQPEEDEATQAESKGDRSPVKKTSAVTSGLVGSTKKVKNSRPSATTVKKQFHRKSQVEETDMFDDIKPTIKGKYSCDTCDFVTNKVREMSNHHKLHKFEQNTCYYCDVRFDDRDELSVHIEKHKGPRPFFCPTCQHRFKSRTMLNMHLPKHSDEKPYICEICSATFKWKHALKGHMVTHSDKKEHLCDICGYSTAHKSQLKAHHLIHTGDLYKCEYPYCTYQSTKKQNLKYHYLTHTREKPHQCEVCGQGFSLLKNMRRHMLLHGKEKKFKCLECDFSSTRYDKLKEHRLKQHGFGTPPEKRVKTSELLLQNIIAPSRIKKEVGMEDIDPAISASSEMIIDDGQRQAAGTSLVLQAIEEQQVVAELEQHVQGTQSISENSAVFEVPIAAPPRSKSEVPKLDKPETYLQVSDLGGKNQTVKVLNVRMGNQVGKLGQVPFVLAGNQLVSANAGQNVILTQQSDLAVPDVLSKEGNTIVTTDILQNVVTGPVVSVPSNDLSTDNTTTVADASGKKVIAIAQNEGDTLTATTALTAEASDNNGMDLNYITTDYAISTSGIIMGSSEDTYTSVTTGANEEYQEYITTDGQVLRLDASGTVLATMEEAGIAVEQRDGQGDVVVGGEEYQEIMVAADDDGNIVTANPELI